VECGQEATPAVAARIARKTDSQYPLRVTVQTPPALRRRRAMRSSERKQSDAIPPTMIARLLALETSCMHFAINPRV